MGTRACPGDVRPGTRTSRPPPSWQPVDMSDDTAPPPLAWIDGRVLPAAEATVPLLDEGFLRGDAVFDAALVRGGRTHALEAHLARLRRSADAMGITVPPVRAAVRALLSAWDGNDGALKLIVTRGGRLVGLLSQPQWPQALSLHTIAMPWHGPLSGVKTLSYAANQWALRQAREAGADDALIVTDDTVMELPTGALCVVADDRVLTPDPDRVPVLDSVTVRELGEICELTYAVLTTADLDRADELFAVSATRPILPVSAVDDRHLPSPGPVTARLRERFAEHIDATLDPLP